MDTSNPSAAAGIDISDLWVSFRPPTGGPPATVLDRVSLQVEEGQFAAVVGPSGCGKTTLMNCVAGLLAYQGSVRVGGAAVTGPGPDRAVVFQSASLFPWKSALRNVAYGLEVRGMRRAAAATAAREAIRMVGLDGYEEYKPAQLSGGMQQRVNLARALVTSP
ncbi:MAG TPA: ATP-binding cassette domain-containing protein, partial [Micromonosporaceae bacterium]